MSEPQVTVVVVPRERFSKTRECIESIIEHTQIPYKMIVVDGGSYDSVRTWLESASKQHDFELIRLDYYVSPNHARNIGMRAVDTKYVTFVDNDVIVTPNWLKTMVECADETDADVVTPLTCQGLPIHHEIHCAGGIAGIDEIEKDGKIERHIRERINHQGRTVEHMKPQYKREETTLAEFHCVFMRMSIFDKIGEFDENMLNTREHVDMCLCVLEAGGTIYFEPDSLCTYLTVPPLDPADVPFYRLRWSDEWQRASLNHFRKKWDLVEDGYFKVRMSRLGMRRQQAIVEPTLEKLGVFGKLPKSYGILDRYHRYLGQRAAMRYNENMSRSAASA